MPTVCCFSSCCCCYCRAGHDVLLFCSRFEAWGMPVLEAMASGLAVVTSCCYGELATTRAQSLR